MNKRHRAGSIVWLQANEAEGWAHEQARILGYNDGTYTVRLESAVGLLVGDGIREVAPDQIEEES